MELDKARLRLMELIADNETDFAALSKALGKNHAYVSQFLRAGKPRELPEDVREALGAFYSVSPDEFRIRPRPEGSASSGPGPKADRPEGGEPMMSIDELEVSGGNAADGFLQVGEDTETERVKATWRVPAAMIRNQTGAPQERIKIITCRGDSNIPEFNPGDRIMVDTSDTNPSPPGFFTIWDGFGELIKQLEMVPYSDPPMVLLKSKNGDYKPRELLLETVVIQGRVIGKWKWT